MSDLTEDDLRRAVMKIDLLLKRRQAFWETPRNVALIVGVTKDLTQRIQAGKVIGPVAQRVGGKGGGRPDLAEAGGKDPSALDAALDDAYGVVESMLG